MGPLQEVRVNSVVTMFLLLYIGGASGAYGSTTGGQAGLPDQPNTGGGGGGGGYYQTNTTFHQGKYIYAMIKGACYHSFHQKCMV